MNACLVEFPGSQGMRGSVVLRGQIKALGEPVDILGVLCTQQKTRGCWMSLGTHLQLLSGIVYALCRQPMSAYTHLTSSDAR